MLLKALTETQENKHLNSRILTNMFVIDNFGINRISIHKEQVSSVMHFKFLTEGLSITYVYDYFTLSPTSLSLSNYKVVKYSMLCTREILHRKAKFEISGNHDCLLV